MYSPSSAEGASYDRIPRTEAERKALHSMVQPDFIYELDLAARKTHCSRQIMDVAHAPFREQARFLSACLEGMPTEVIMQIQMRCVDEPGRLLGTDATLLSLRRSPTLRRDLKEGFMEDHGWDRYQMATVLGMLLDINSEDLYLHIGLYARMYSPTDPVYPGYNPAFLGSVPASFYSSRERAQFADIGRVLLCHLAANAVCVRGWAGLARALRQFPSSFPMCELRSTAAFCPEYTRGLENFPMPLLREPTVEAFMWRLVAIVGGSGPYPERQALARLLFIIGPRIPTLEGHIGYFSMIDAPPGASRFGANPPDHIVQEYHREHNQSRGSQLLLQLYS